MENSSLTNKTCTPCQREKLSLGKEATEKLLRDLGSNWQINDKGHLYKPFKFKDFIGSMTFANKIAEIAEEEGHHPDLIIAWGKCAVEIWTHKINGLSKKDFILAAKLEAIYPKMNNIWPT
jgi:4a-hydroxytetrahydrobiopterin dehydratase